MAPTQMISYPEDNSSTMSSQKEDKMDENDINTLQQAKKCQEHGETLTATIKDPIKFQPYLESLLKSLAKRESVLGRYNHVTAQSYAALGNAYVQMEEPRAIAMYRTCYRIQTFLYGKTNGHISGMFKDMLERRGLKGKEIENIRADILLSARHEMEGDLLRRFGNKKDAAMEYQKAARVEEFSFGRDNPDLAYLWRKLAFLAAIKKSNLAIVDFDEADRMGNRWLSKSKDLVAHGVAAAIKHGDNHFGKQLYSHAVGEYYKASTAVAQHKEAEPRKSKAPKKADKVDKAEKKPKSPKKKIKESSDVADELQMLLSSSTRGGLGDVTGERAHQTSSPDPFEPTFIDENEGFPDNTRHSPFAASAAHTGQAHSDPFANDRSGQTRKDLRPPEVTSTYSSSLGVIVKRSKEPSKKKSRQTLDKHLPKKKDSTGRQLATSDASSFVSALSDNSKPLQPDSSRSRKVERVISTSKIRRRSRGSTRSVTSLIHQPPNTPAASEAPAKPKSDSYLSKIAHKTRKVASKTSKMAKKQLQRASSIKDFGSAIRDISNRGSQRSKSNAPTDDEDSFHSAPKSTKSYGALRSPPGTPYVHNDDARSFASFGDLESPSQKEEEKPFSKSSMADSHLTESIADSAYLTPLWNEIARSDKSLKRSTKPKTAVDKDEVEPSSGLGFFFTQSSSDETVPVDNRSLTEQSVMTTDEEIRERFLSASALAAEQIQETQAYKDEEDSDPSPASLVDLVAHVQTMSSLLQRQTVRLQNRLGNGDSPTSEKKPSLRRTRSMSTDAKQLYEEIQSSFEECDETLRLAFAQMDGSSDPTSESGVLTEFRGTFTMEKAFVEELRRKLNNFVAQSPSVGSSGSFEVASPQSGYDDAYTATTPVAGSSSHNRRISAGDLLTAVEDGFQRDSNLSIVFEEKSTPSDQQHERAQVALPSIADLRMR